MITPEEYTEWVRRNVSPQDVQRILESRLDDTHQKATVMREYRQQLADLRRRKGFYMLGSAAILCLFSMLGTLLDSHAWLNSFFLFGLTPAGVGIGLYGLWLILEDF